MDFMVRREIWLSLTAALFYRQRFPGITDDVLSNFPTSPTQFIRFHANLTLPTANNEPYILTITLFLFLNMPSFNGPLPNVRSLEYYIDSRLASESLTQELNYGLIDRERNGINRVQGILIELWSMLLNRQFKLDIDILTLQKVQSVHSSILSSPRL
jgi:hypothetical protein